jgi:hypothetical protein
MDLKTSKWLAYGNCRFAFPSREALRKWFHPKLLQVLIKKYNFRITILRNVTPLAVSQDQLVYDEQE